MKRSPAQARRLASALLGGGAPRSLCPVFGRVPGLEYTNRRLHEAELRKGRK